MSAGNITCTTRHHQLYACKILFLWHQYLIVKSSGQTSWQTQTQTNKQTNIQGEIIITSLSRVMKIWWIWFRFELLDASYHLSIPIHFEIIAVLFVSPSIGLAAPGNAENRPPCVPFLWVNIPSPLASLYVCCNYLTMKTNSGNLFYSFIFFNIHYLNRYSGEMNCWYSQLNMDCCLSSSTLHSEGEVS